MTIVTSEQRLHPIETRRLRTPRPDAPSVLALFALACAAVGLVGWVLHLDTVVGFVSYSVIPKFNGVLVLTLLSVALICGGRPNGRRLEVTLALVALVIAGATVLEWLSAVDLRLDEALVSDWTGVGYPGAAGRMSLIAAAGFTMVSLAIVFPRTIKAERVAADLLALATLALGLLSLVSWLLGVSTFALQTQVGPASAVTGLGMLLLGAAEFLRAHPGVVSLLTGWGPDSRFARGALGATVVLPIVLGTLASILDRTGHIAERVDSALIVVGTIFVGGTVSLYASILVSRHIRALEQALTDQRATERERRFMASIVETAGDAVHTADLDGRITSWNGAAEKLYGWTAEEAIGSERSIIVPEDELAESFAMTDRVAAKEVQRTEAVRTTKDGRRILVSIAMSPIVDDEGDPIGYSLIVRDITEQKRVQAELEQARRELERSNRDLQDFASVASHDLQEPLRKIRSFGDRLEHRLGDSLDINSAADLARVQDAAQRMQQLIEDLLAYSRVSTRAKPFEPVDLQLIANTVQEDLEQAIAESGGRIDVGPLPTIEADPVQMRQLLQNLIGNALKFRLPDRPPVVTVRATSEPGQDAAGHSRLTWTIDVSDNGIGIDERHVERIFQPFERLHGRTEYPGTGMGLAICMRIAKRHGGDVTVTGVPGQGTTFHVVLPGSHPHDRSVPVAA